MKAPAKKSSRRSRPKRMGGMGRWVADSVNVHPNVQWLESPHAQLFVCQNFLSDKDCDLLINMIDAQAIPSSLYTGTEREGYRTRYSYNINLHNQNIQRIEQSICDLVGLENSHSEVMQGDRKSTR